MPSPCPSDGTEPICLFPVHPVKPSVFPWLVPGVLNPFPGPDMNMLPFTDVQNAWASPAPTPKGENAIFQNGMRIGLWSPWVSSLTRPELTLLLGGEEAAFRRPCASTPFSLAWVVGGHGQGAADSPACCTAMEAGWSRGGETCFGPTDTPRGRPRTERQVQVKWKGFKTTEEVFKYGYLQQRL